MWFALNIWNDILLVSYKFLIHIINVKLIYFRFVLVFQWKNTWENMKWLIYESNKVLYCECHGWRVLLDTMWSGGHINNRARRPVIGCGDRLAIESTWTFPGEPDAKSPHIKRCYLVEQVWLTSLFTETFSCLGHDLFEESFPMTWHWSLKTETIHLCSNKQIHHTIEILRKWWTQWTSWGWSWWQKAVWLCSTDLVPLSAGSRIKSLMDRQVWQLSSTQGDAKTSLFTSLHWPHSALWPSYLFVDPQIWEKTFIF